MVGAGRQVYERLVGVGVEVEVLCQGRNTRKGHQSQGGIEKTPLQSGQPREIGEVTKSRVAGYPLEMRCLNCAAELQGWDFDKQQAA